MGELLGRIGRRGTQSHVRLVTPVPPDAADGLVGKVYAQLDQDFGMLAPPVTLHSPAPGPLAATWLMLRESMVADGLVRRPVKEAVAVAVSQLNACPYCVDVHSAALHGLGRGWDAEALAGRRPISGELGETIRWASASGRLRDAVAAVLPAPAPHVPELIGTVVSFQYLNRMVNIFLTRSPIPLALPAAVRRTARRVVGRILRPVLNWPVLPGAANELLPAAPLPADLAWATGNPVLADAYARAVGAIEAAGRRSVPPSVRELLGARLAAWNGEPTGLLRDWAFDAVAVLPRGDQPAGLLALLAAFSSYQVGPSVVEGFRQHHRPDDRSVIEVASWASLAAARTHGEWLWRAMAERQEDSNPEEARRRSSP